MDQATGSDEVRCCIGQAGEREPGESGAQSLADFYRFEDAVLRLFDEAEDAQAVIGSPSPIADPPLRWRQWLHVKVRPSVRPEPLSISWPRNSTSAGYPCHQ
jgi:hypothetical protein